MSLKVSRRAVQRASIDIAHGDFGDVGLLAFMGALVIVVAKVLVAACTSTPG
jgi:hypothetical protein